MNDALHIEKETAHCIRLPCSPRPSVGSDEARKPSVASTLWRLSVKLLSRVRPRCAAVRTGGVYTTHEPYP